MFQLPFCVFHPLIDHLLGFCSSAGESLPQDLEGWHVNEHEVALESASVDLLSALEVDLEDGDLC